MKYINTILLKTNNERLIHVFDFNAILSLEVLDEAHFSIRGCVVELRHGVHVPLESRETMHTIVVPITK